MRMVSLLLQKRMLIVLVLGFASGLPLGLTGSTLQAWYAIENIDLVTIGFLGLVGQPYVYKFFWAPAMDKIVLPGGRRRGWILACQGALIATLIVMASLSPKDTPVLLGFLALVLAFFSASQDVAVDAYRVEILNPEERGSGAAMAVAGYRIAMLVSGGLALVLAHYIGFQETFFIMGLCVGISMLATFFAPEPKQYGAPPLSFKAACIEPFKDFLTRPQAVGLLLLVVLYKLGDACAGSMTTVFLLRGVGFSLAEVGMINKTVGLISTLLGVFAGGILLSRVSLFKSLLWFGVLQAFSNLAYIALSYAGTNHLLMASCVFLENFCGGLGTAAFMALLMSLCHIQYTATQYALLSALSAVGRVFISPVAGVLVEKYDWSGFFFWSLLISLPGIMLLFWMRDSLTQQDVTPKEALSF